MVGFTIIPCEKSAFFDWLCGYQQREEGVLENEGLYRAISFTMRVVDTEGMRNFSAWLWVTMELRVVDMKSDSVGTEAVVIVTVSLEHISPEPTNGVISWDVMQNLDL